MPEEVSRTETTIAASAEQIWEALVTPRLLKEFFFGADVESTFQPGSPIRFRGDWQGKAYEDKGTIEAAEPPVRLAYTHWSAMSGAEDRPENYHLVTFDLQPVGAATRVVLTQTNPDGAAPVSEASRAEFTRNWSMVLAGLKRTVEG